MRGRNCVSIRKGGAMNLYGMPGPVSQKHHTFYNCSRTWLLTVLVLLQLVFARAQCVPSTTNSGSVSVNNAAVGSVLWSSLAGVLGSDDIYATVGSLGSGVVSNYITVTNFGFSIPSSVTLCGIVVEVERGAGGVIPLVTDNSVRIIKNGTLTGVNAAQSGLWPVADGYTTYGSSTYTWGTTWTPAEINASNFGIAISANLDAVLLPSARIDNVRITVHYNNTTLPVEMAGFTAARHGLHGALLQWETASETNSSWFEARRSVDGAYWVPVNRIQAAGHSYVRQKYALTDAACPDELCYYQLVQGDADGSQHYFPPLYLAPKNKDENDIRVVYHSADALIRITSHEPLHEISLYSPEGALVEDSRPAPGNDVSISTAAASPGIYVLKIRCESGAGCFKKIIIR